jgi:hypothetical protein
VPLTVQADGQLQVTADVYYCQDGKEALCYFKQLQWRVPLKVGAAASKTVTIEQAL